MLGGLETACKSKEQGGLGIVDLRTQNCSLLMKFLHKFYNKLHILWVDLSWKCLYANEVVPHVKRPVGSFWWRDVMSQSMHFFQLAHCKVKSGDTVCFWTDHWDLPSLHMLFPQLHSFVRNQKISVRKFLSQDAYSNFTTPLSVVAADQLLDLVALVQNLEGDATLADQ